MKLFPILALSSALALTACGGDEPTPSGEGEPIGQSGAGPCDAAGSLCMMVHVPDDFQGQPTALLVGLYNDPPIPATAPPVELLPFIEAPEIGVGNPYELKIENLASDGAYYLFVALYMEGSTMTQPVAGLDYQGGTDKKYILGEGPVNVGDLRLALVP